MYRHVLILGGHGKVAQHLTPILLKRAWTVTSIIRTDEQVPTIEKLAAGQPGHLKILVRSLEEISEESQAKEILEEVKPDCIVWSAGAGGKGAPERTFKIDRDAASCFIRAAVSISTISKFILISYIGSRRAKPAWWSDEDWEATVKINQEALARYHQAKLAADEVLFRESKKRESFVGISLRPGGLTDEEAGKVELGKTKKSRGDTSRQSVAVVTSLLLENESIQSCWLDLLDGNEEASEAVERVAKEGVDVVEGEPLST